MWTSVRRTTLGAATFGAAICLMAPGHFPASSPPPSQTPHDAPARPAVETARMRALRVVLEHGLDALDADLTRLASARTLGDPARARDAFRASRRDYKSVEGLVEFYGPALVTALNGPGTTDSDDEPTTGRVVPKGFPLIEPLLFPTYDRAQRRTIASAVNDMLIAVRAFRRATPYVKVTDPQRLEIARTEIARVSTLGIAGFDATSSGDGIPESAAALEGTATVLMTNGSAEDRRVAQRVHDAAMYLRAHPHFDTFDRFAFITQYANPAAHAVGGLRRALPGPQLLLRRAWRLEAGSVYDAGAMDAQAYAPAEAPRPDSTLIALGRTLFFDPALSGNGARACASCHRPELGFTDGLPRAQAFDLAPSHNRRTPSLVNAAYQPAQFADERVASLEQQVAAVLASPTEMHSSVDRAVRVVNTSTDYRQQFRRAFPKRSAETVTPYLLQSALAAYVRSLTAMNSRFDRAIRGDTVTLTSAERHGFNLFMGKARCGTCHFAPVFNGTAPPGYLSSEVEVIGVPSAHVVRRATIDADSGRATVDHLEGHVHAFKVPTVRNITLATRFMHNGVFRTLDDVLDFYNRGGGAGIGAHVPNATLSDTPLHLTASEKRDIIAFLGALVDTTGLTRRPARLPRIDSSAVDATMHVADRQIGGRY